MIDVRRQQGFTIIEVVLFLAISGLLVVLLMTGWTVRINTERYRDSVVTLQSFLQQQYNLVYNVENDRGNDLACDNQARVQAGSSEKGQTNCVLLGRFITIQASSNDTNITVSPVVGLDTAPDDSDAGKTLPELFLDPYRVKTVSQNIGLSETEFAIPWGATVVGGRDMTIAILRDPQTGIAHTYSTGSEVALTNLLRQAESINIEEERRVCLDPGAPFSGEQMAVVIRAKASSQSAVETEAGC